MELCTNLQQRVLDLEKTKITQAEEIVSLKRRVKKLEQKKRSRTYRLKRLYKVGLTARVESSRDEESLGEDASKQGMINAIDADEGITLVNDQDDADMFYVNTLTGDEVLAEQEVAAKDVNLIVDEVTLAQALASLKSVKPKVKANVIEEPSDKGKGKMVEEPEKPLKKKVQIMLDEEEAKRLHAEFDEEERLAREKDEANVKLRKAKYGSTRPVEDLDLIIWGDLKTMFEPHVEDIVWKNQQDYRVLDWKLYDSCEVHSLRMQRMHIHMLGRIVRIKSLLNAVSITAALIDVNAAQSKLVLLENFNENYSKCLRLLYKVNAAEGVNAASEEVSTAELVSTAYLKEFNLLKWDQHSSTGSFAGADLLVLEHLVRVLPFGVSLVVDGFFEESDSLVLLLLVFLPSIKTEFPPIVFNDTLISEVTLSYEHTVSPLDESHDEDYTVKMDDPNITMEEYIRLEEEKAHSRGKVYNWETATYGKIWNDEDVHGLRSVETEFPAIVFNDAFTSEVTLSCELHNNTMFFAQALYDNLDKLEIHLSLFINAHYNTKF
ncbi:hypothetical protein Tco_0569738 [Tanacetum coccineum]